MTQRGAAAAVDQSGRGAATAMAEIGKIPGGGVSRQALSGDDVRARALLGHWRRAAIFPSVDAIANLFVRRPGQAPDAAPVLAGSHMDSQPAGGRFDGIFGVLAALEALEALDDAGIATAPPLDLVAWTTTRRAGVRARRHGLGGIRRTHPAWRLSRNRRCGGVTVRDALADTLAATPGLPRRAFGFRSPRTPSRTSSRGRSSRRAATRSAWSPAFCQGARWRTWSRWTASPATPALRAARPQGCARRGRDHLRARRS